MLTNSLWRGDSGLSELVFENADDNWEQRSDNTGGSDIANLTKRLQPAKRSEKLTAADTADQSRESCSRWVRGFGP